MRPLLANLRHNCFVYSVNSSAKVMIIFDLTIYYMQFFRAKSEKRSVIANHLIAECKESSVINMSLLVHCCIGLKWEIQHGKTHAIAGSVCLEIDGNTFSNFPLQRNTFFMNPPTFLRCYLLHFFVQNEKKKEPSRWRTACSTIPARKTGETCWQAWV